MATKCCKTSGYHCYAKDDTTAQCAKTCSPSSNNLCSPLSETLQLEPDYMKPARSLFCFSVYTQDTGSPKQSYELELLTQQLERKVSIFACDAYDVYSDAEVSLGGGVMTKKVTDVKGDWHFAKRKETGSWVNTGMFIQVWKAIGEANVYQNYDWVVKVDADAVFVPERLQERIQWMPRTTGGTMLQNCQYVDYGFFGNLEVLSGKAFEVLLGNLDSCYTDVDWKVGVKDGKYGPMGEDLFAEICMAANGVDKVEAFDVSIDGACPAKRPEDEKKNKKWKSDRNAEGIRQGDDRPRYRPEHRGVRPVFLADCPQRSGLLFEGTGELHGHQMLQDLRLPLLCQRRHYRAVREDLLTKFEQFVQSLE